jgi:hypothetical protein
MGIGNVACHLENGTMGFTAAERWGHVGDASRWEVRKSGPFHGAVRLCQVHLPESHCVDDEPGRDSFRDSGMAFLVRVELT